MTVSDRVLKGVGVSPGVVVGQAYVAEWSLPDVPRVQIAEEDVEAEVERLREAVTAVKAHLVDLRERALERVGPEEAKIFDAQVLMLEDPEFFAGVEHLIRDNHHSAERAFEFEALELRLVWAQSDNPILRQRRADLLGIGVRLLQHLMGKPIEQALEDQRDLPTIVFLRELTPDLMVEFDGDSGVVGLVSLEGTRTSHAAILAHSLGMPCVMGVTGSLDAVTNDTQVILDGTRGTILTDPSAEEIADALVREESRLALQGELERADAGSTETADGEIVALRGNLDLPEELPQSVENGAEGVGLLRTEFLVAGRAEMPTEEEQTRYFERVGAALPGHPIVIRSYDLGGDKFPAAFRRTREPNPFLGWRAIRVCLDEPEIFQPQIRALLRARANYDIQLMLPLVTTVDEVTQTRAVVQATMADLQREGIPFGDDLPVGVMIETPAAVQIAAELAHRADFLSVGTNDLTQYTLAVDRGNAGLADRFSSFHPAVVRQLATIANVARDAGVPVSVCGEMASDPLAAYLLLGLGYRVFSVAPPRLRLVRWVMRQLNASEAATTAVDVLKAVTKQELVAILGNVLGERIDTEMFVAGQLPHQSAQTSLRS